jgi:protein tyrosine kinase modulator
METSGARVPGGRQKAAAEAAQVQLEHYLRLILRRKWLVLGVFFTVSLATVIITFRLPNIYTSETVILVDPQKVPEGYVKSTITGDVRNRLGTLSQQILSATRLQKIIDTLDLYPIERKTLAREDVVTLMRRDISVNVLSEFGGGQDLQAFRIMYSGRDPRMVAQVTNELAALFIEENLKAREQQATGTTEFLVNQLQESRKTLEAQEAKLRDFKLKHLGEMPEQETADLQILGQLQSQLQLESDALSRAEQQKSYIQAMMAQSAAPVVDLDDEAPNEPKTAMERQAPRSALATDKARLAALLTRYSEEHPEVRRVKKQIEMEEAKEALEGKQSSAAGPAAPTVPAPPVKRIVSPPARHSNPVLESQLNGIEAEITKHKAEQQRLSQLAGNYQTKLEAIPVREQQISELVRDYEISKAHYSQLLEKQLSAETATQLEIRQKGERFSVLDPAQPAERPSRPKRTLINIGGSLGGLILGLLLALSTEFLGASITAPEQITGATGLPVLEVIPEIKTRADRVIRKRRLIWAAASAAAMVLGCGALLLYYYRTQIF